MLKKVKDLLGIEGVKVNLMVPDVIDSEVGRVGGIIKFTTLSNQTVTGFSIKMIEKYSRGKKENTLINEYILGHITRNEKFKIIKDEIIEFDFELPFVTGKSAMDKMEEENFLYKALVKTAKYLRRVKSEYKLVAEAHVVGVKLNPSTEQVINIK